MPKPSTTKRVDTYWAFATDEPFKDVAKRFGLSPNTLRAWWVANFGQQAFRERGRKLHVRAARKASLARVKPVQNGEKECSRCKRSKVLAEFCPRRQRNRSSWCLLCRRAYSRLYTKTWRRANQVQRKRLIASYKDRPCADCGGVFPPYVMDFDHVRGEKLMDVSAMTNWNLEKIISEIGKCEVVCSNCHRIRTHSRKQHFSPPPSEAY